MEHLYNSTEKLTQEAITPQNILIQIWKSPRRVFNFINDYKYEKHITLLLILAGIGRTLNRASFNNMGDKSSLTTIIIMSLIVGVIFGWLTYYIYASLLSWTGQWLNGVATARSILRILAYALIPSIIGTFFIIPQIIIYGSEIFKSDGDISSAGAIGNSIFYISLATESILAFWSAILIVIGLAQIQRFSIGKAIINLLLPLFILFAALMIFVLLYQAFF